MTAYLYITTFTTDCPLLLTLTLAFTCEVADGYHQHPISEIMLVVTTSNIPVAILSNMILDMPAFSLSSTSLIALLLMLSITAAFKFVTGIIHGRVYVGGAAHGYEQLRDFARHLVRVLAPTHNRLQSLVQAHPHDGEPTFYVVLLLWQLRHKCAFSLSSMSAIGKSVARIGGPAASAPCLTSCTWSPLATGKIDMFRARIQDVTMIMGCSVHKNCKGST